MVPTFQYGAKTDRRALQSKFKSWAKRMTVFNGDLVLANSKKVILPLEKCEELIIFLHSQEHMSVDRIVSNTIFQDSEIDSVELGASNIYDYPMDIFPEDDISSKEYPSTQSICLNKSNPISERMLETANNSFSTNMLVNRRENHDGITVSEATMDFTIPLTRIDLKISLQRTIF
ncbi:hypothetical protein CEXT_783781 [Caerostris extrusa]|uniref:Uncharacterized protein n=1 Tax=Caerostris extrusa TaxID=172846 RepID=A0AAV4R3K3_CAEEX|nr:hypothetical protein CEXT_783781 [Caerostris extrusa]